MYKVYKRKWMLCLDMSLILKRANDVCENFPK